MVAVVSAVPATIAAVAALASRRQSTAARQIAATNKEHIDRLAISVDGRLTRLLSVVEEAALLRGRSEGAITARADDALAAEGARTDDRRAVASEHPAKEQSDG